MGGRAFIMQGKGTWYRGKATQVQHRSVEIINLIANEWTFYQSNTEGSCRCLMRIHRSHIGTLDSPQ